VYICSNNLRKSRYQIFANSALGFNAFQSFTGAGKQNPSIVGPGAVDFAGLTTTVTGTLTISGGTEVNAFSGASFSLNGGTINLAFVFPLPSPTLVLNNNDFSGGTLTAGPGSQVTVSGGLELSGTTFNTQFQVAWTDSNISLNNGAVVNNTGTWTVANANNPTNVTPGGDLTGTFNNNGILNQNMLGKVVTVNTPFNNNNQNNSQLQISSGSVSFSGAWQNGAGTVNFLGGTLVVNGNSTNNGTLAVPNNGTINAMTVTNNGTIDMAVANSNANGTLLISGINGQGGNFVQAAGGTLNLQLTGDGLNDLLGVTGTMTLGGTLNVTLGGNYMPGNGQTWTLLTSGGARNGTFANVTKPQGFNDPLYNNNSVTIGN
jgi:fibronectin-binding autotransporter adhesin